MANGTTIVTAAVKAGAHLTRNHFKRKIITAGVSIFSALAVSASGFAAWILSAEANKEGNGNVSVGVVEKSEITISDLSFVNDAKDFVFEPKADDTTGRVRASADSAESLTVKFTCTIDNVSAAANISVEFFEPAEITAAVAAGYLVSPDLGSTNKVTIKSAGAVTPTGSLPRGWSYTEADGQGTLTCEITYAWGSVFGGENPGIYYDTVAEGIAVPYEEVEKTLHAFKAMCHGLTYTPDDASDDDQEGTYEKWYNSYVANNFDTDHSNDVAELASPQYKVLISASA